MIISGQDVVLDILANYLHQEDINAGRTYLSSFEGLLALYQGKVDAAAAICMMEKSAMSPLCEA